MNEKKMQSYDKYTYDKKVKIKGIIKTAMIVVAAASLTLTSYTLFTSKKSAEKANEKKPAVELVQNEQVNFVAPTKLVMEQKSTEMETIGHMQAMTDSLKEEIKDQSAKTSNEISSLKEDVSSYASQVQENNSKLDQLGKNVDALHGDVSSLGNNVNALHSDVSSLGSNVDALHGDVSSLGDNVSNIENKVEEYQSTLDNKVEEAVRKIEENRRIELEAKQAQEVQDATTPVAEAEENIVVEPIVQEETQNVDFEVAPTDIEAPVEAEENLEQPVEEAEQIVETEQPAVEPTEEVAEEKSKLASSTIDHFKRESSSTHAVDTGVSYKDSTLAAAALYNNIITTKENGQDVSSLGIYGGVAYANGNLKTNSVDLTAGAMYKTKTDKGLVTSVGGQFTSSINPKAEISPTIEINAGLGNIKVGKNATLDINAGFMAGGSNSDNSPSGKVTGRISWGSNSSQLSDDVRLYELKDKINNVIENATANNKKFANIKNAIQTPDNPTPNPTPNPNPNPTPETGALTPNTDHPETPEFNF